VGGRRSASEGEQIQDSSPSVTIFINLVCLVNLFSVGISKIYDRKINFTCNYGR
jgi:hypothetical protein